MIHGLYQQLAENIARQADATARLADPEISANERHSLEWTAGDLERASARLGIMIRENETLAIRIGEILRDVTDVCDKSRFRALCRTDLEQAQDRLLRELGDIPASH